MSWFDSFVAGFIGAGLFGLPRALFLVFDALEDDNPFRIDWMSVAIGGGYWLLWIAAVVYAAFKMTG